MIAHHPWATRHERSQRAGPVRPRSWSLASIWPGLGEPDELDPVDLDLADLDLGDLDHGGNDLHDIGAGTR
jgi:hypothetical protein